MIDWSDIKYEFGFQLRVLWYKFSKLFRLKWYWEEQKNWHHVVITNNGVSTDTYIDGVLQHNMSNFFISAWFNGAYDTK